MLIRCIYLLLFFSFSFFAVQAQKESNIWVGRQARLDFNFEPPKVVPMQEVNISGGPNASIADKDGNLLFFTDGVNVFTGDGTVMPNGELRPDQLYLFSVVIVPMPNSQGQYYIITSEGQLNTSLQYAVVDMRLNGGRGEVITKNIIIGPAPGNNWSNQVIGNCDNSEFWIIHGGYQNTFSAYKIDAKGISTTPVSSTFPTSGAQIGEFKMSPLGNKIIFNSYKVSEILLNFADFNFSSGKFTNHSTVAVVRRLDFYEFSPNGQVLYANEDINFGSLAQFDLTFSSASEILKTKIIISPQSSLGSLPGLASNGKIYSLINGFISFIGNPNKLGTGCDYRPNYMALEGMSNWTPTFVRTFLQEGGYSGITVDSGKDTVVCSGQNLQLGQPASDPSFSYQWTPGSYLSDPQAPNPTFRHTLEANEAEAEITYTLTVTRGGCSNSSQVRVKVQPPAPQITGSRSVCPGVEGVEYQLQNVAGQLYHWKVEGGSIVSGQGTAAIKVNWGHSNSNARVEVEMPNARFCAGQPLQLPVRINVELDTETPQGQDSICANLRQGNLYRVTHTTGSIYTWNLTGGTIVSGQGTSGVLVDWDLQGPHLIWLQEQSTTKDTVCFGISDSLAITVYNDETDLSMQFVSVSLTDSRLIEAYWVSSGSGRLSFPLTLHRRQQGAGGSPFMTSLATSASPYLDPGLQTGEEVFEYWVEVRNGCEEPLRTEVHSTVRLTGQSNQQMPGLINLEWNSYKGWPEGVERYEIWRRLDEEGEQQKIAQVGGIEFSFGELSALDGFTHRFRIRAIARSTGFASWSNELALEYEHQLKIPNVFTPNVDGYNETFQIPLLELYSDNQLAVFNRWGQIVYKSDGYRNDWKGEDLSNGTYYYSLEIRRTGKIYKGWVEIMR